MSPLLVDYLTIDA